jgi:exopolyphosphatase/pppGpp-phosphohydrolase
VARRQGDGLEQLLDVSEFAALGKGVDHTGTLEPARMEAALAAIARFVDQAKDLGAEDVQAIATSAVRDAANGAEFVARVRALTGVNLSIISGEQEAKLTFQGATLGVPLEEGVVVADLGGGSTEIIASDAEGIRWGKSLQIGSNRLTERHIHHDPPTAAELGAVAAEVHGQLDTLPPFTATTAVFTGGTASHVVLLCFAMSAPLTAAEPLLSDGEASGLKHPSYGMAPTGASPGPGSLQAQPSSPTVQVTLGAIHAVVDLLRTKRSTQLVTEHRIQPERALVLAAGARALEAIGQYYGVRRITITRRGIREGALLERAMSNEP